MSGALKHLTDLPNIGKAIAADLFAIGIHSPGELQAKDAWAVYCELRGVMGHRHDPCVFYTLLSVNHYLTSGESVPWWKFTAQGKTKMAQELRGKS